MLTKILRKLYTTMSFLEKEGLSLYLKLKKDGVHPSRYDLFNKSWLKELNIKSVLDIGANKGEFSLIFNYVFNQPLIHAFEPLPSCQSILEEISSKNKNIKVHPVALGDEKTSESLHVSSWNPSSSFLTMGELHKSGYPHSSGSEDIQVDVERLDDYILSHEIQNNLFIKMDVQGFEKKVIEGGIKTFSMASVIVTEMSFRELYDGEPKFHELYELIISLGFSYQGSLKQSVDKTSDGYFQCDGIFLNNRHLES